MRITVMCGAGASSTFVALRVRRAAAARSLDLDVSAAPAESLDDLLGSELRAGDVLMLGAHLAGRADEMGAACAAVGVRLALLPETAGADADGDAALDLALAAAEGGGR